jgi:hypothetical protein
MHFFVSGVNAVLRIGVMEFSYQGTPSGVPSSLYETAGFSPLDSASTLESGIPRLSHQQWGQFQQPNWKRRRNRHCLSQCRTLSSTHAGGGIY